MKKLLLCLMLLFLGLSGVQAQHWRGGWHRGLGGGRHWGGGGWYRHGWYGNRGWYGGGWNGGYWRGGSVIIGVSPAYYPGYYGYGYPGYYGGYPSYYGGYGYGGGCGYGYGYLKKNAPGGICTLTTRILATPRRSRPFYSSGIRLENLLRMCARFSVALP